MPFNERKNGGVLWMEASNIASPHAFTTRLGGVSSGYLESLNLGENRGDSEENVRENWRRLSAATGIPLGANLVYSRQVHGRDVLTAPREAPPHRVYDSVPYEADGYVTAERGLALVIFTADCAPLLMEDPQAGVIAAVHCGWRSTVADIPGAAVERMLSLGARAENIRAAVGPAIARCCFETGPEVPEAVVRLLGPEGEALFAPEEGVPGKFMTDNRGAVRLRLTQLGLLPEHIEVSGECTRCLSGKYWSHRATAGVRGSQANIIMLQ